MIIGISGKKQSGKTTVATYLARALNGEIASFASVLKDTVLEHFGGSYAGCFVDKTLPWKYGLTYRQLLQKLGHFGRTLSPTFWVDLAMRGIGSNKHYIFDDLRFPEEAKAILERGGQIIRLTGGDHSDMDTSETALDDYPFDVKIHTAKLAPELWGMAALRSLDGRRLR